MGHHLDNMRRQWLGTFGGVLAIAVALMVPTALVLAGVGVERLGQGAARTLEAEVIMAQGATPEAARALAGELRGWAGVEAVEVRDGAANLASLQREVGGLDGLDPASLPTSLRVRLTDPARDMGPLGEKLAGIAARPEVEGVEAGSAEVAGLVQALGPLRSWLHGVALVVGLVGLVVVANGLGLGIFRRREEIEALRHIGAADRHIIWPLLVESLWIGALGGLVSAGALAAGLVALADPLAAAAPALSLEPGLVLWTLPALLLAGVIMAWSGALVSLRVYLRQVEEMAW